MLYFSPLFAGGGGQLKKLDKQLLVLLMSSCIADFTGKFIKPDRALKMCSYLFVFI